MADGFEEMKRVNVRNIMDAFEVTPAELGLEHDEYANATDEQAEVLREAGKDVREALRGMTLQFDGIDNSMNAHYEDGYRAAMRDHETHESFHSDPRQGCRWCAEPRTC